MKTFVVRAVGVVFPALLAAGCSTVAAGFRRVTDGN